MDLGQFFGGFLLYIAPPVVSVISRKVRKKPNLKNPIWQYVITFIVMTMIMVSGSHPDFDTIIIIGIFVYISCFFIDFSSYRQNKVVINELTSLNFNNSEEVMQFTKSHPHLIDEIGKLIDIHKKLKH